MSVNFIRRWRIATAASARKKMQPHLERGWENASATLTDAEKSFFRKVYKVLETIVFGGMTGALIWVASTLLISHLGVEVVLAVAITATLTFSAIEDFDAAGWFRI